jgi:hypothetical protein
LNLRVTVSGCSRRPSSPGRKPSGRRIPICGCTGETENFVGYRNWYQWGQIIKRDTLPIYANDDLFTLHARISPLNSDGGLIAGSGRCHRPRDSVGDGAVDDAGAAAGSEPGGGSGVDELAGDVVAVGAGGGDGAGQAAGVEGDGEQVAVQVAAEGAGAGGLAAAACGRLDLAGVKAGWTGMPGRPRPRAA